MTKLEVTCERFAIKGNLYPVIALVSNICIRCSLTLSQFGNFSLAQVQISSLLACYRPYGKRRVSNRGTKGSLGWVTYGSKPLSFYPSVTNAPIIIAWSRMEMYQQTHRLWFNDKLASKWSLLHYWIPRALHNFVRVTSRGYWSRHNVTNFQLFFNYIFINRAKQKGEQFRNGLTIGNFELNSRHFRKSFEVHALGPSKLENFCWSA